MFARGRAVADAIAREALSDACAAAHEALGDPACRGGGLPAFEALGRACAYLSERDRTLPRWLGLAGLVVLRDAAAGLREACCREAAQGQALEAIERAVNVHQGIDAACTALGAAPACYVDADEWGLQGHDGTVRLSGLLARAGTAAMLAEGLAELALSTGRDMALVRRDAEVLAAGSLVLVAACHEERGLPEGPVRALAAEMQDRVARIAAAAGSWKALAPDAAAGRVAPVLEASADFARDVLAEMGAGAAPPGP